MTLSLRLRLATWYGTITGAVVMVVCVYAYVVHSRTHYDEVDLMLGGSASHIARELEESQASAERQSVLEGAHSLGAWARIYDSRDAVVQESGGAGSLPAFAPSTLRLERTPTATNHRLSEQRASSIAGMFATLSTDERWRVVVFPIRRDDARLAMIFPLEHIDASVRRFGLLMTTIGMIGAAAAFFIGWLISGRALRPVSSLTEVAIRTARSGGLSGRVPDSDGRDELGRLATAFNEMLSSLESAAIAQHRFLADASHELRAPLAVVLANLDLVSRRSGIARQERDAVIEDARREAERMSRLVADLLILARSDSGLELEMRAVDLDAVVMKAIGDVRHVAPGRSIRIAAIEPSVVIGNADSLRQLVIIILDNAIRYTRENGGVSVSLIRSAQGAVLKVTDTGVGISATELPHVFERFYRAEAARSHDPRGTGLGLSIAKWIVDKHGGSISIESTPGRGTTVSIEVATVQDRVASG